MGAAMMAARRQRGGCRWAPAWRALWLLALAAGAASAQTGGAVPERSDAQWLQLMQTAARRLNYSGTIFHQMGSDVRVSRLVHFFDGAVSHARLQMLDGERREFIRRADEVQCLIPEARRVVVERRPLGSGFPALSAAAPEEILQQYRLHVGGVERVADIECQVLHLQPKDALRFGYRLWVDRTSGLLLRAQMLDEREEVIEQLAFTEVRVGERFDPARLKPSWPTEGWSIERVEAQPVDFGKLGWALVVPDGFRQLSAVKRRITRSAAGAAIHAVYSDGLATFSVFIEPGRSATATGATPPRGATNGYIHRVGDALVTVVGEVPMATVRSVALSVEARATR
jgi:sigma-E factor negative regulatory protein RseB